MLVCGTDNCPIKSGGRWDPSDDCCERRCTPEHPCLFDVVADPTESKNLAAARPEILSQLKHQLSTYRTYVDGKMTPEQLSRYNCSLGRGHWKKFLGPCCIRKQEQEGDASHDEKVFV